MPASFPPSVNLLNGIVTQSAALTALGLSGANGSLVLGNAPGGNMGAGTINATALFINGTAVGSTSTAAITSGNIAGVTLSYSKQLFQDGTPIAAVVFGSSGQNTYFGENAGAASSLTAPLTTQNSFFGHFAGSATLDGGENTFIGSLAGVWNVSGHQSTYVGCGAGWHELSAFNCAFGSDTYRNTVSSQASGANSAFGTNAMRNGSGFQNTAIGDNALPGSATTILFSGTQTAGDVVTITFTVGATGAARYNFAPFTHAVPVTVTAGQTTAQLVTAVGNAINAQIPLLMPTGTQAGIGTNYIGMTFAGSASTGTQCAITASVSGAATEIITIFPGFVGSNNIALGFNSFISPFATTASSNIAIGLNTLQNITTGSAGIYIGQQTGQAITIGVGNVFIGNIAGISATTCTNAVGIGENSLNAMVTGSYDVAVGGGAMQFYIGQGTGLQNVGIGGFALAGAANSTFSASVGIGYQAGKALANGNRLVIIGTQAALLATGIVNNTIIGTGVASAVLINGINNILIGSGAITGGPIQVDTAASNTSNTINIGNVITATGTNTIATSILSLAGNLKVGGHFGSSLVNAAPTISAGGTLDATASDMAGTVTGAAASTGFVVTFGTAYATVPHVTVTSPSGAVVTSYAVTTTTLTVVTPSATGATFTYQAVQ